MTVTGADFIAGFNPNMAWPVGVIDPNAVRTVIAPNTTASFRITGSLRKFDDKNHIYLYPVFIPADTRGLF